MTLLDEYLEVQSIEEFSSSGILEFPFELVEFDEVDGFRNLDLDLPARRSNDQNNSPPPNYDETEPPPTYEEAMQQWDSKKNI